METTIQLNNQNPVKENGEHLKEIKNIGGDKKIEGHINNENSEDYNPRLSHVPRHSSFSPPHTETFNSKPIPPPIEKKPKEQDGMILPKDVWSNTITRRVLEPENDVPIGFMFDVCEDKFNQINILKNYMAKLYDKSIKTLSYIAEEPNLKKFFEAFTIEDELKASIICGLTKIPDYAEYFTFYQLNGEVMMALVYSVIVKSIQIDQNSKVVLQTLNLQKASNATHFLTGIDYGFTAILCIKHPILQTIQETQAKLKDVLENFKLAIANKTALKREYSDILVESLNFDYLPNNSGLQPGNISEALKILQSLASAENIDHSGPIRYHLAPLFPLINSKNKAIPKACPKQTLDTLIQFYMESRESTLSTRKFNDCNERIFYGLDHCVHCKCGATSVSNCLYKCNDIEHGKKYTRFEDMNAYKRLLNNLPKPKEQNILLLGETGVGKSTFINAFANYLKFNNLQEALESEPVCMIASKYSVEADLNVRSYKDKWRTVDIGDATELPKIPTGQSVTQNAMAYTFELRLIKTKAKQYSYWGKFIKLK
uniref:G domain-containing protein n=1 Tax=Acrobeloides nanus TaxID=290746 RepID=A0A914CD71_9BILA